LRKRLALYYLEPGHDQEIRFFLPQGSYVPEFRLPAPATVPIQAPLEEPTAPVRARRLGARGFSIAAALAASVLSAWLLLHLPQTELDAFWAPLLEDHADALLCIEQPLRVYNFDGPRYDELNQKMVGSASAPAASAEVRRETSVQLSELRAAGQHYFTFGDLMASTRLVELLARKGKAFQVLGDRMTSYNDLRGRPAVLIGQFNNRWTNGLTGGLRYYLDKNLDKRTYEVRDRQNAGKVIGSVPRDDTRPEDYAIVSRVFDPSTGKTVIAVVGMTYMGTSAGGDFLTNPSYMREVFRGAPANWRRKNIQVVLKTTLVGGTTGPLKVVAMHFW
jgi:hypothetical protein